MTLDDIIEPESKFVSVQQCQRPIMIAKLMLFIQIRTIVIKKVTFLICDAKLQLFCELYVRE